jgi:excisionase family DNA binding protein
LAASSAPRKYETLAEAGARAGVSPRTLRRRIADGDLTGYRFGPRLLRVDAAEVDALLQAMPNARTAA